MTTDIVGKVFDWGFSGWEREILFIFGRFIVELANRAQLCEQVA
jgi:hypothetical protein